MIKETVNTSEDNIASEWQVHFELYVCAINVSIPAGDSQVDKEHYFGSWVFHIARAKQHIIRLQIQMDIADVMQVFQAVQLYSTLSE